MKKIIFLLSIFLVLCSCRTDKKPNLSAKVAQKPKIVYEYGFRLNDYKVINDTIKSGESFGVILDSHHVSYPKINQIALEIKDTFDVRRVRAGKPYTILASKDSLEKAQTFIYKHNKIVATIVQFKDSVITAYTYKKPVKTIEKEVMGEILSNLSEAMDSLHLNSTLTYEIADIYAWTLDFYKLQKGDTFKFIYEERFIDDTIFAGYGKVKAVVFTHKNQDLYAYNYLADSIKKVYEYYDDKGGMLRSQFLKSPIKFQHRISSRYNLRRKIKFYGRVRPHRGTDFAAKYNTPIMSTANGTVIESARRGGNGNYVKVKHNSTYTTQYLHMKRRKVRVGDYVKQGDIIGWIGMTGNTSGPHVCYRFWKHGKEVDPFRQKLPSAKPLKDTIKEQYLEFIKPLKNQLDLIAAPNNKETLVAKNLIVNN